MNTPYLDIHTHRRDPYPDSVSVASLSVQELLESALVLDFSCAGIHPWWLEDKTLDEISELKLKINYLASTGNLMAIGETGIDRTYPEFLELQVDLFLWHLDLAEKNALPLIIHCVRAGSDFLKIIKEKKPTTPWIFHDFRGGHELVKDLLRLHPLCFFSFGLSVDNSPQVRELLPLIPISNIFLETDDQKHLDIHDIYLRASHFLGIEVDFLKSQLWHNFSKLTLK